MSVPFAGGIDEKTQSQFVAPGSMTKLANSVFTKRNAGRKRDGTKVLATAPFVPTRLLTYKSQLVATDGNQLASYVQSVGGGEFVNVDTTPGNIDATSNTSQCVAGPRIGIAQTLGGITSYDEAIFGNLKCVAYIGGQTYYGGTSTLIAFIEDLTTGATAFAPGLVGTNQTLATSGSTVRVILVNGRFVVAWSVFGTGVVASTIDATSPAAWTTTHTLVGGLGNGVFDAQPVAGVNSMVTVIENPGGGLFVSLATVSGAGVITQTATAAVGTDTGLVAISAVATAGERVWLTYVLQTGGGGSTATVTRIVGLDPSTLAVTTALATAMTHTEPGTGDGARVAATRLNPTTVHIASTGFTSGSLSFAVTSWAAWGTAGVVQAQASWPHFVIHGSPKVVNGRVYAPVFFCGPEGELTLQGTMWIVRFGRVGNAPFPVATIAPRTCKSQLNFAIPVIPSFPLISGTTYDAMLDVNVAGTQRTDLHTCHVAFGDPSLLQGAELGEHLNLTGGIPCIYDGSRVSEIGALFYPEGGTAVDGGTGGGLAAGTYQYTAVYERYDTRGQIHESVPMTPISVTLSESGHKVTVTIPSLTMTMWTNQDSAQTLTTQWGIAIYRTSVVAGVAGTIFYRVPPDILPATLAVSPVGAAIVYTDTLADSTVTDGTHRILYTQGGELDNVSPSSVSCAAVYNERLWLAGCDDPKLIWFSQALSDGTAPGFNEVLSMRCDENVTALMAMDDKLIIFAATSIFFVAGQGPDETGAGSDLLAPERISSDVGCIDSNSVTRCAEGILFRSNAGIYLLSRSLEVEYRGAPVEDSLNAQPTVLAAVVLDPVAHQRFVLAAPGQPSTVLVYDDTFKLWTTYVYSNAAGAQIALGAATRFRDLFTFSDSAGIVYQDDPTTHLDAGVTWVPQSATGAWFMAGGVENWARWRWVYFLGEYATDHDLTVSLAYDYMPTPQKSYTWTSDLVDGSLVLGTMERAPLHVNIQKAKSIQITVSDAAPTGAGATIGTGEGVHFLSLDLEYGVLPGKLSRKRPTAVQA